jgi:hypothetical protein
MSRGLNLTTAAAIAALAVGLPAGSARGTQTVFVPAAAGWTDTGIDVAAGASVAADGYATTIAPTNPILPSPSVWSGRSGPDGQPFACSSFADATGPHPCLVEGAPYGALVGMVGGNTFVIGSGGTIAPSGELMLAVNDNEGYFFDNDGGYAVHVG